MTEMVNWNEIYFSVQIIYAQIASWIASRYFRSIQTPSAFIQRKFIYNGKSYNKFFKK